MASVVADTHAVLWYLLDPDRLSPAALAAPETVAPSGDVIHVSAISLVEIAYLFEKGALPEAVLERLEMAITDPDMEIETAPLDLAVAQAVRRIPRDAVPDMPDRIIAATALHLRLPLVTRDNRLRSADVDTIW